MRIFSIGVIGAGAIAQQTHLPVLAAMPNVRIAWVADVVADRARRVAGAYGAPSVGLTGKPDELPQCDAVLLAVPLGARNAYYPVFAQRRTGVFVEKPFAATVEDHRRIVKQFEPHLLVCGLMRRTYANTLLLQAMVQEEWFGPLESMSIAEGGRATRTGADRTYMDDHRIAGGGVLLDLGCHTLDLALFITGAQSHKVEKREVIRDGEIDRKVTTSIELSNVGGKAGPYCRLDYCVSWLDCQPNTISLSFAGATVSVGTTPDARMVVGQRAANRARAALASNEPAARTSFQAFYLEWDHFLKGLEAGQPSVISAASCESTTALIEQIYERGAAPCLK